MKKFNLKKKKIKDGQIHDLRYFKDHVVKELELFFIFRLEAGSINRSYRAPNMCQTRRRTILIIMGLYSEWAAIRVNGFLITAHAKAETVGLGSRM